MLRTDYKLFEIHKKNLERALATQAKLTPVFLEHDNCQDLIRSSKLLMEHVQELKQKMKISREKVAEFLSQESKQNKG